MSKKSKQRTKEANRKIKAARKAAQQAKYQAWKLAGENQKSKRHVLRGRRTRMSHTKHLNLIPFCGNTGCIRCFPRAKRHYFRLSDKGHQETRTLM